MSNNPQIQANADGISPDLVPEFVMGVYNSATGKIDRLEGSAAGGLPTRTLVGGAGGDQVNTRKQKIALVSTTLLLLASWNIQFDVTFGCDTLKIDWVVSAITGTNIIMAINQIDEQGVSRQIDTATVAAANGTAGLTWILGVGANPPGTNGTRRFPDPFNRTIQLAFTETALTAITGTISVVGS